MRRWRCPSHPSLITTTSSLIPIPTPTIIITIIHLQFPPHNLKPIQIPDRGRRGVDVAVLEEAEALGFAGFFVVDEAEGEDGADAGEDVADLFFGDAWNDILGPTSLDAIRVPTIRYVADEHDAAALFAVLCHAFLLRVCA